MSKLPTLPKDWKSVSLAELADANAPIRYGVVQIGVDTPGGIPIVPIKHIRTIGDSPLHRAAQDIEARYAGSRIQGGDVLISVKGTIGHVGIVPEGFSGNLAREIARIRPNKKIDRRYLALQLQAPETQRRIQAATVGSTRLEFSIATLRAFQIAVPPLSEQKLIADVLTVWERAIETTEKLIANSERQKMALLQQLLTRKRRLPGFSGNWTRTSLDEIGTITSAGVDKKTVEGEQPVRLLNFLDVYRREFLRSAEFNQVVTAPSKKIAQCDVKKGDIFFTPSSETRHDIGLSAVAAEDMPGVVYSYHVIRLRPSVPVDLQFSAYLFQSDDFRRQTYAAGDGSGQRYVIAQDRFRSMTVLLPPLGEQQAIGQALFNASATILALRSDLLRLKSEKTALMQQLLAGKRRVNRADIAA